MGIVDEIMSDALRAGERARLQEVSDRLTQEIVPHLMRAYVDETRNKGVPRSVVIAALHMCYCTMYCTALHDCGGRDGTVIDPEVIADVCAKGHRDMILHFLRMGVGRQGVSL